MTMCVLTKLRFPTGRCSSTRTGNTVGTHCHVHPAVTTAFAKPRPGSTTVTEEEMSNGAKRSAGHRLFLKGSPFHRGVLLPPPRTPLTVRHTVLARLLSVTNASPVPSTERPLGNKGSAAGPLQHPLLLWLSSSRPSWTPRSLARLGPLVPAAHQDTPCLWPHPAPP